jgi:hypothetical protein
VGTAHPTKSPYLNCIAIGANLGFAFINSTQKVRSLLQFMKLRVRSHRSLTEIVGAENYESKILFGSYRIYHCDRQWHFVWFSQFRSTLPAEQISYFYRAQSIQLVTLSVGSCSDIAWNRSGSNPVRKGSLLPELGIVGQQDILGLVIPA